MEHLLFQDFCLKEREDKRVMEISFLRHGQVLWEIFIWDTWGPRGTSSQFYLQGMRNIHC